MKSRELSLYDQGQNRKPNVTPFQHSTGSPSRAIGEERELRTILIEKENVKLSLFADDSIISIVLRLEKSIKNGELCKVVGYKIRIRESFVFLYANNYLPKILRK